MCAVDCAAELGCQQQVQKQGPVLQGLFQAHKEDRDRRKRCAQSVEVWVYIQWQRSVLLEWLKGAGKLL